MDSTTNSYSTNSSSATWTNAIILFALTGVSVSVAILWTDPNRFTMIGIFCALFISLADHSRSFVGIFVLAGISILLSFSRQPFDATLFILAANAIVTIWYLSRIMWAQSRHPSDIGVLVTSFLCLGMFLIIDLHVVDAVLTTYFSFLFFLLKPLSWIPPKQLTEKESYKLEFVCGVLSVLAFAHVYKIEASVELSMIAALCGGALVFFGSGMAAPALIFISIVYLVPEWIVFGGLTAFCILYGGWPLRILFVIMATAYALQFHLSQNPIFWVTATSACLFLGILFMRKIPNIDSLKMEWQGIILSLVLFGLPIYLNPELIKIDSAEFDGMTIGAVLVFMISIVLFIFWKPRFIYGMRFSFRLWERFVNYIQVERHDVPYETVATYRVDDGIKRSAVVEHNSYQVIVWLLVVAIAVIVLGGL